LELLVQISRKAEYALRAMAYLAGLREMETASISIVAKAQGIPRDFLAKILKELARAGLARAYRGAGGGYCLAHPADEITFLQVLEAADGPLVINSCSIPHNCSCPDAEGCSMSKFWQHLQALCVHELSNATLDKYPAT
jgi:Rrf2 family protein